jgi:site-specific recombinase XerD
MNKTIKGDLFFSKTKDFLDIYLSKQCNKSPNTVKAYRDALTIFRHFIHDEKGLSICSFQFSDCTYDFVLDYTIYLKEKKHYVENSCNQRLAALKSYLSYVADADITLQQISLSISKVPFQTVPKRNRPVISDDALAAMLSAPSDSKIGIRDRTILILLFDSAIRLDELLSLKISDVDLIGTNPYLRIHGKGDKERIVAITDQTVKHLKLYMRYYHVATERKCPLIYTIIKGMLNVMSPGNVERIIKKYATIIRNEYPGLPESVYPHMFRNPNLNKIQTFLPKPTYRLTIWL